MSVPHVAIRRAGIRDAAAIAGLAAQLGYPVSPEQAEERLTALAAREDHVVLVADLPPGHVVGWIHVFSAGTLIETPAAEIGGLIVDEACRSFGIGRFLVEAAEAWAKERGFLRMRVRSNVVRLRAHAFYRSLGYCCTKTQGHFIKGLADLVRDTEGS